MKDVILQVRYPYTATTLAIMWLGTTVVCIVRTDIVLEVVLSLLVIATLIVAFVGFSTPRR